MTDLIFDTINENIQPEDLASMLSIEVEDGIVEETGKLIGFSGFNPIVTFNICVNLMGRDNERKKDLVTLIIFGLTRGFGNGKTLQKILDRTKEEGKESLLSAMTLFRIQFGKPTSNKSITISRIMIAFPIIVYKVHKQLVDLGMKRPVNFETDLPEYFQYPGSPAAMKKETWDLYKEDYQDYCEHLAGLWGKTYDAEDSDKYAELAFKSPLSPMINREWLESNSSSFTIITRKDSLKAENELKDLIESKKAYNLEMKRLENENFTEIKLDGSKSERKTKNMFIINSECKKLTLDNRLKPVRDKKLRVTKFLDYSDLDESFLNNKYDQSLRIDFEKTYLPKEYELHREEMMSCDVGIEKLEEGRILPNFEYDGPRLSDEYYSDQSDYLS